MFHRVLTGPFELAWMGLSMHPLSGSLLHHHEPAPSNAVLNYSWTM